MNSCRRSHGVPPRADRGKSTAKIMDCITSRTDCCGEVAFTIINIYIHYRHMYIYIYHIIHKLLPRIDNLACEAETCAPFKGLRPHGSTEL